MVETYNHLKQELAQNPQNLRDIFSAVDKSKGKIDSCFLDTILGIPIIKGRGREHIDATSPENAGLGTWDYVYEGTTYGVIQKILRKIKPGPHDTVVDIGSGYGRFCLYGALTTDAKYVGIDVVKNRVAKAQEISQKLHVPNVSFLNEDVLNADITQGTIFYMFNPFYPNRYDAQKKLEGKLAKLAEDKPITVVTLSMANHFPLVLPSVFEKTAKIPSSQSAIEVFKSTS